MPYSTYRKVVALGLNPDGSVKQVEVMEYRETHGGEVRRGVTVGKEGRDHHPWAFSGWLAGGGTRAGAIHGETDEFGYNVVRDGVHAHDLQATILRLLGVDHERLTYRFQGRDYRLTDVHGKVIRPILA